MTAGPSVDAPPGTAAEGAAEVLSTAPAQVPGSGAAPVRAGSAGIRRLWRQLTSMRTALVLLFLLALAAVPGSLFPQRSLNPVRVAQYARAHPALAPVLDRLSLFDVFRAPWFAAVYLLLFTSLVGCLVPRIRLHARALRRPPPRVPARLDRLPHSTSWTTGREPADVLSAAGALLRRRRFRVRVDDGAVAAEKGYLRETGNLVFHVSLVLLLAGVALGAAFGYTGSALLVAGRTFTNAVPLYDTFTSGTLVHPDRLAPFSFTLDRFRATYQPDGTPRTFDADVTYRDRPDSPPRTADVRVNAPLRFGAAKVYLLGHGYAPHFVVRDRGGRVAFDDYVPCLPQDASFASTCTVKVPDARPQQLGFSGVFFPTATLDPATPARGFFSSSPRPDRPAMTVLAWAGDLGLDDGVPQSVYSLDTRRLQRVGVRLLAPGDPTGRTMTLPGGQTLTVDGYREWATFQVKRDPAKGLVLLASVGIVVGLVTSLRVRRRRVWVRAGRDGSSGRTLVAVGGLTRSDPDGFAAEFAALAADLARTAPAVPDSEEDAWVPTSASPG